MSRTGRAPRRGGLVVLGLGLASLAGCDTQVRVASATRSDVEQHVVASGRVRVPARVKVSAQMPGLVVEVGAVEGQHVKAGDLLVRLDDAEARAAVGQARASVDQASAKVQQLRRVGAIVTTEGLRQAQTNLERAETDLSRTRILTEGGAAPVVQLEEAKRAVDIATAQKTVAEAQQISSAPLGADSRVALTALLQARAQLTAANVGLEQTRITARAEGVVLSRSCEVGDVVQPSQTLFVMAVDADTQLVFQSDERNLAAIAIGQHARASADAYPQQVFDAFVSYIAPSIDPQRGSVEVRLRVPTPPAILKPDMTISIDLAVGSAKQAVTVPSVAIRGASDPTPYVYVVDQGHIGRRELKLGLRGDSVVEVLSGLEEGAAVVLPGGKVSVGERVRTEKN